jgi:hypothetical protein
MHTWLTEERYLEDLPEPYENPKEAAIARARENGPRKAKRPKETGKSGLSSRTPIGRHAVKIIGSEVTGGGFSEEAELQFHFRIESGDCEGTEFSHAFKFVSRDETAQFEGQSIYAQLRSATGVLEPNDTSDFHDRPLRAVVGPMGRISYETLL